jgi:dTDP-4-amino-4,6-dideoxygalactose transaminase
MGVAFLELEPTYNELREELDEAVSRVLRSGWYILGNEVESFEQSYSSFCEVKHCVGVGNGLDALYLCLLAMGVESGDEVIVPSNTYIATWLAVSQCGARPIPVEPDNSTYNLNPDLVEQAISSRTKAIIAVHLYGQPANLEPLSTIAKRRGIWLLEDAAQSHGARYTGRPIGGHGDAVAWSFYPGKNLGAFGDAGAVTTNDGAFAEKIRVYRNYGSRLKYVNDVRGVNTRLDPIQAAILRVKLAHLVEWNQRRRKLVMRYQHGLRGLRLKLPHVPDWVEPAWHLYVVRTTERDALQKALTDAQIGTLIHYPIPPHLQKAYSDLGYKRGDFPVAEAMAQEVLSLPLGPHLSEAQQDLVLEAVQRFFA